MSDISCIPPPLIITTEMFRQILERTTRLPSSIVKSPLKIKEENDDQPVPVPTPPKADSSSSSSVSSSSSSSHQHFVYDNVPQMPPPRLVPTPSPFIYPAQSQFRRQASLNAAAQLLPNPVIPTTPYTPPPMLSPFRKGPGLYYRVFSHPGSAEAESPLVITPAQDESTVAKINIGQNYQATIPKLRTNDDRHYYDQSIMEDELLFSPENLPHLDESSLEKYESLYRTNPTLFSPRHAPQIYSLELVYMLLYEYGGDLQHTLRTLLQGVANDISPCRPVCRMRFPECDQWTYEEIKAFTKAIQTTEKNFGSVSRAVRSIVIDESVEM